jgi:hypothetical protein
MKPFGIVAALLVSVALSISGEELPSRPPNAVLPLAVADPTSHVPLGEAVELIFEVVDTEPDLSATVGTKTMTPPYPVETQLRILAHTDQDFLAQGCWRGRQVTVSGVVRAMDKKTGVVPISYSISVASVSGPHKTETAATSGAHLRPQEPTQIGGFTGEDNGVRRACTLVVWVRPHVTPDQDPPLLKRP